MIRYTIQLPKLPDMDLTHRRVSVTRNGAVIVYALDPTAMEFVFEAHADERISLSMRDEAGIECFSPVSPILEFDSTDDMIPPQPGPLTIIDQEVV